MVREKQPQRVSTKFREDMKQAMLERVNAGLMDLNEAKMPKITELLTKTQGYHLSLKELKTKPEKKK